MTLLTPFGDSARDIDEKLKSQWSSQYSEFGPSPYRAQGSLAHQNTPRATFKIFKPYMAPPVKKFAHPWLSNITATSQNLYCKNSCLRVAHTHTCTLSAAVATVGCAIRKAEQNKTPVCVHRSGLQPRLSSSDSPPPTNRGEFVCVRCVCVFHRETFREDGSLLPTPLHR